MAPKKFRPGDDGGRAVNIGTSGWNYKHWKGRFYPPKMPAERFLAHYAAFFNTVEVNKSFYRLIDRDTWARWKGTTPVPFVFAVKGSRFLTHMKKLTDTERGLNRFFDPLAGLGRKRGPVLFQLPPHWKKNTERLDSFLKAMPKNINVVFEFRNPTWFSDDVYDILEKYKTSLCIYDYNGRTSPIETTSSLVYLRFHGPDSYDERTLDRVWARFIRDQTQDGRTVYVYFNNDASAFAIHNAQSLKRMVTQ